LPNVANFKINGAYTFIQLQTIPRRKLGKEK
jgi:hypothetical protein